MQFHLFRKLTRANEFQIEREKLYEYFLPQVGGELFGVRLPIFNFKFQFENNIKSSKFPSFTNEKLW